MHLFQVIILGDPFPWLYKSTFSRQTYTQPTVHIYCDSENSNWVIQITCKVSPQSHFPLKLANYRTNMSVALQVVWVPQCVIPAWFTCSNLVKEPSENIIPKERQTADVISMISGSGTASTLCQKRFLWEATFFLRTEWWGETGCFLPSVCASVLHALSLNRLWESWVLQGRSSFWALVC